MSAGRHAGIPTGVQVVLQRAGKVLLMRRAGTGFFDGLWGLPGGHVEEGESLAQTACREMREELGINLQPSGLETLGVIHRRSDTNRIDFFLRAPDWSGVPEVCEPDKCDALGWFALDDLPDNTIPYVRLGLAQPQAGWLLESGWTP